MTVVLWSTVAVLASLAMVYVAASRTRRLMQPIDLAPGEDLPVTPVQRLARTTLAVGASATALVPPW